MIKKTAVLFFILTLFTTQSASAQNEECNLGQGDFEKLQSVTHDSSLGYFDKIKRELQIRKELLRATLHCAVSDAEDIKTGLDKVTLNDQGAANLQSQFANQLDNAIGYYKIQESKIGDLGLQGSKDFAKNLESWREGNYTQMAQMATHFLIWAKNQVLMETAQARMDQTSQSVTLLKLVYNEEIQNLWKKADGSFFEAKRLNQEARSDLMTKTPDEALAAIKASLDSLSKTYERLSEVVSAINKALALPE